MRRGWMWLACRRVTHLGPWSRATHGSKFPPAIPRQPGTARRVFHADTHLQAEDVIPLRKELKEAAKAARSERRVENGHTRTVREDQNPDWELTVGIEIHAQLNTARKLFSSASTEPTLEPNTKLAPFDLSLPGSQPKFQYATLIPAIRAAVALGCTIEPVSRFDRKHYFYHDQPAGYQITQYYQPFATNGSLTLDMSDGLQEGEELVIGIKQVQMEQDTARTQEQDINTSLIDFNRAGHPLIEIISLPHIHSPRVAAAYVRKVQALLFSADAVTTGMELGGLRADVNVSVRRRDSDAGEHSYGGVKGLGQRTEIKNLSTFKGVEDAIKAERDRQIALLEAGSTVEGETRRWTMTNPGVTTRLRGKEGEVDYRYMPDPDIPPLYIGPDVVKQLTETLPPSPEQLCRMLVDHYGLSDVDARALSGLDDGDRLIYFQQVIEDWQQMETPPAAASKTQEMGRVAGNWVLHELGALLTADGAAWTYDTVPVEALATILHLQSQNKITGTSARRVLQLVYAGDRQRVEDIVEQQGLAFVPLSAGEYEALAAKIIVENPQVVRDYQKTGKHGKLMFLLGQMMKAGDRGRMEATTAEEALRSQLSK